MTITRESHIMDQPSSDGLPPNSQSAMFLQATRFVSDLLQRASFDTPAMLRELIDGAATSVPGAQCAGITVTEKRRRSQTAAATHRYPVMLDEIQSRLGIALLFITHDLRVAAQICDDVAVMQNGRIVEQGPAARVLTNPQVAYTRALLDAAPGREWDFANFRPVAVAAAAQ